MKQTANAYKSYDRLLKRCSLVTLLILRVSVDSSINFLTEFGWRNLLCLAKCWNSKKLPYTIGVRTWKRQRGVIISSSFHFGTVSVRCFVYMVLLTCSDCVHEWNRYTRYRDQSMGYSRTASIWSDGWFDSIAVGGLFQVQLETNIQHFPFIIHSIYYISWLILCDDLLGNFLISFFKISMTCTCALMPSSATEHVHQVIPHHSATYFWREQSTRLSFSYSICSHTLAWACFLPIYRLQILHMLDTNIVTRMRRRHHGMLGKHCTVVIICVTRTTTILLRYRQPLQIVTRMIEISILGRLVSQSTVNVLCTQ